MRIDQRHDDGESFIRASQHADFAIGFRHIFHEPLDGIVCVGRVIHHARIERTSQRPGHYVFSFRPILAANILKYPDVPVRSEHLIAFRQNGKHARRLSSFRTSGGVVRCAGHDHRRVPGAFRNNDDRMQLDAVAHRNHDFAFDMVVGPRWRFEFRWNVGRQRRDLRLNDCGAHEQYGREQALPNGCGEHEKF